MSHPQTKLLYDGNCPFCRQKIEWLRRRDHHGRLEFLDITAEDFDPARFGRSADQLAQALHAALPDGTVVQGMDAVRAAYRAIGRGWLVAPTRWPVLRTIFDRAYAMFARNRSKWDPRLTGQCDHECPTGSR